MRSRVWVTVVVCALMAIVAGVIVTARASAAPTCNNTWVGGHNANDWGTAANWTNGVPSGTTNTAICIETGSAVLNTGTALPTSFTSIDIGSTGIAQLTVGIAEVLQSASTTVASNGTLTLNGTYYGANAGNAALGGGPVNNAGRIVMEGSGYTATLFGTIVNTGTITVPYGAVSFCQGGNGGAGSVDNRGTITVDGPNSTYPNDPAGVSVTQCAFTDDTGGSLVNNGSFGVAGSGSSYTQGSGTETGNAVTMGQQSSLAYTGAGASSVNVPTSIPMTGNLAAGQQLYLDIGTNVTEPGSFVNAGQITLDGTYHGGGGGPAQITVASGTFTNAGSLTAISGAALSGTVINGGTVTIAANSALELVSGSFTNAASGVFAPQVSSSQYGDLQIDGGTTFTAGGTLSPQLIGGFTPTVGQSFGVVNIRGGSYSGQFATNAASWHADYSSPGAISAIYGAGPNVTATPPAQTTTTSMTPPASTTTTTTTKTTPVPAAAPKVSTVAGGAAVISAKLKCSSTRTCASYSITASVTEHLKGTKLTAVTAVAKRTKVTNKVVTVASAKGTLKAGKSVTAKLALNRAGLALLKRFGKLKVSVAITVNHKVIKRETVTVTEPKPKKKTKK